MATLLSTMLWNSAAALAMAAVVFLLSRIPAFERRPALLHLMWFAVLVRMIVPVAVPVPLLPSSPVTVRVQSEFTDALPSNFSVSIVPAAPLADNVAPVIKPTESTPATLSLTLLLVAVSLTGTGFLVLRCLSRWRRLGQLLRDSHDPPARFVELADSAARRMGISAMPRVRLVDGLASPSVLLGWRQPTILLPWHLLETFDDDQWSCILAHELAHLARRDHWFNFAGSAVLLVHWWNPIAWWAWRELQVHQEASCDALAISQFPRSRRRYAETLLEVVESWNRRPLFQPQVLLSFGKRSLLTRRFEMIANSSVRPKAALAATLMLALGALTFFCVPVRAEKKEPTAAVPTAIVEQLNQLVAANAAQNAAAKEPTEAEILQQRTASKNNLKQIMLALHNYHDAYGAFPPPILFGKGNKGGQFPHSWRVALLPYLDQSKLYEQYQFDEAWDSPDNKAVLSKMPAVFRAPGTDEKSADTAYVVLVGNRQADDSKPEKLDTLFSSYKGVRIQMVRDGTSNTLAVFETKLDAKDAIPWTKPLDIEYDSAKPVPKLGGFYEDGFYAGICDGSVRLVPKTVPDESLKILIGPADGKVAPNF